MQKEEKVIKVLIVTYEYLLLLGEELLDYLIHQNHSFNRMSLTIMVVLIALIESWLMYVEILLMMLNLLYIYVLMNILKDQKVLLR